MRAAHNVHADSELTERLPPGFREYIASPVLLHALANTEYSRRIRELQASRRAGGRSGEKLTWWDMRMNKVPDTAISGAFTGAILNAWKRMCTIIVFVSQLTI